MAFQFEAFTTGQVSVGGTPTQIVGVNADRANLIIENLGTTDVFLGDANVTTTTGHLLTGTKGAVQTFSTTAAVYGITSGASQGVSFLQSQ
jgi:hypothetical protein